MSLIIFKKAKIRTFDLEFAVVSVVGFTSYETGTLNQDPIFLDEIVTTDNNYISIHETGTLNQDPIFADEPETSTVIGFEFVQ